MPLYTLCHPSLFEDLTDFTFGSTDDSLLVGFSWNDDFIFKRNVFIVDFGISVAGRWGPIGEPQIRFGVSLVSG